MGRVCPITLDTDALLDEIGRVAPEIDGGKVDRNPFELGNTGRTLLDREAAIVVDRDECDGLFAALIDVPTLGHSRHDHRAITGVLCTRMDMSQGPIIEAPTMEIRRLARCVEIVACRSGEARMHDSDIDRIGSRAVIFLEKAFRGLRFCEAQAVDRYGEIAAGKGDGVRTTAEHGHRWGGSTPG